MAGRNKNHKVEQMCSLFINYLEKRDLTISSTHAMEEFYNKFIGNSPYKIAFSEILDYFAFNNYIITGNNSQLTFTARVRQLITAEDKTAPISSQVDKLERWYKKLPEETAKENGFHTQNNNEEKVKCCFCNCIILLNSTEEHKQTKQHRVEFLKYMLKRNESDLLQDKHGVSITCREQSSPSARIDFSSAPGEIIKRTFKISFSLCSEEYITFTNEKSVVFTACELLHRLPYLSLDDKYNVCDGAKYVEIPDGMSYNVIVTASVDYVGHYCVPLAFRFAFKDSLQPFHIVRWIDLSCTDNTVSSLEPIEPYKPPPKIIRSETAEEIVEGLRPKALTEENELENIIELTPHEIPEELVKFIEQKMKSWKSIDKHLENVIVSVRKLLIAGANPEQYECFFETLLYMEEIQMDIDIRKYDLTNVTLNIDKNNKRLLVLEVPGLMENRPSLLKGDQLYVRIRHKNVVESIEYRGYVHIVRSNEVVLGFHNRLLQQYVKGTRFDVRFTCTKYPMSVMHRALGFTSKLNVMPVLFPVPNICTSPAASEGNLVFFDRKIEDNNEQATAVRQILSGNSRPAPYLLFGPPGTGKTVTLVEAIKQIWKSNRKSRILVCAPSNSATDLLTQRLITHIPHKQVFRMYAASRAIETVPDVIKNCSNISCRTGMFIYPSRNELMKYRVIVTTLVTSARLVSADFDINHFTHMFIDEAGYAMEPEAIIPIAGLMQSSLNNESGGHLILAGDPKQLGPVLRSPEAIEYRLGISLLERLMDIKEIYGRKENKYDSRFLTKLLKNYRSHPAILQIPNDLFYAGELQVCANKDEREMLSSWEDLPIKGFPVLFHGVVGSDRREERSPSYFNPEEISIVVSYVKKLLDCRKLGVRLQGKDIGLISPYRRQVQKIQNLLQEQRYNGITVGSVEEFQGQERKVIIISTVRSNPNLVALDHEYKLGFLRNPKRFNVAVTRAKALLIIVGNPMILSRDFHWNSILEYCCIMKSYCGAPYTCVEDEIDDIVQRVSYLEIVNENENDEKTFKSIPISQRTWQEDPEWRAEL